MAHYNSLSLKIQWVSVKKYDYLIIGSGLFGSVFAKEIVKNGQNALILEKRAIPGGNVSVDEVEGVRVHTHGPHIFHTGCERIWNYVNNLTTVWPYKHKVKATYQDRIYTLPFGMETFYQMWGCKTPQEARGQVELRKQHIKHPKNMEEWALANLGPELYYTFIYGYTKKQWMREPKDLPISLIHRIPIRFTWNDNYYRHFYQGIPDYKRLIEQLIDGIDMKLDADFFDIHDWRSLANKLVYSGPIDQFFNYEYGHLEYRGLRFEHEFVTGDFQGVAQMNYTDESIPFTRIVEHGHFTPGWDPGIEGNSVITYEYPIEWEPGLERYYPVNDDKNNDLYLKYRDKIKHQNDVIIGGRLASFKYLNMDQVIAQAISTVDREINPK